jgi:hypothetical protein
VICEGLSCLVHGQKIVYVYHASLVKIGDKEKTTREASIIDGCVFFV